MNLRKYDDKCVKIIDIFGREYEGNCVFNNKGYNYHEFGKNQDSLQILYFMFYKDIIKKIIVLDKGFVDDYGLLEEEIILDGVDYVKDSFDYEDDEHICRLIKYIKDHKDIKNRDEMIEKVKEHLKYNDNEDVKTELKGL